MIVVRSWSKDGKGGKRVKKIIRADGHESEYESDEERFGVKTKTRGKGGQGGKGGKPEFKDDSDTESFIGADGKKKRRMRKGVDEVVESDYEYEIVSYM